MRLLALLCLLFPSLAMADSLDTGDTGDTAWILTSTALVLFMTLPGLSLFYAGLVRRKNVLSVLSSCISGQQSSKTPTASSTSSSWK